MSTAVPLPAPERIAPPLERAAAWAVRWWEVSWTSQVLALLAALGAYAAVGLLNAGDLVAAQAHADWIIDLERATRTDVEGAVQRALDGAAIATLLSAVYLGAQFVVAPLALLIVHHRAPRTTYRTFRDALLLAWTTGLVIYAVFPVAPPRMASAAGVSDVVSARSPIDLSGGSAGLFNQLAAVPSMHVAFAVAVSVALWRVARGPALRLAAVLWAPLVVTSVVATGNHFTFDALTGAVVMAFAAGTVVVVRGRVQRALAPA